MPKFELDTAKFLIDFAIKAYNDETQLNLEEINFSLVKFINNQETDTQLFLAKDENRVVVAFRGTTSLHDMWTDIKIKKGTFPRLNFFQRLFSLHSILKSKAHEGFFESYKSVEKEIHNKVRNLISENVYKIYITGHSLGGALAILCALDLKTMFNLDVTIYTFGGPKVGNKRFVGYYEKRVLDTFRVVNDEDPVQ